MIRGQQTRDEFAGAVIANFVVVVTKERVSKNLCVNDTKGLNVRALPFKILPCASALSGDIVQILYVQAVVTFGFWPFAVVLRNMSKQAIVFLSRMLGFPEIVVAIFWILLVELTLLVRQACKVKVDSSNVAATCAIFTPQNEIP